MTRIPIFTKFYLIIDKSLNIAINLLLFNLLTTLKLLMNLYWQAFVFICSDCYKLFFTCDKVLLNWFILNKLLVFNTLSKFVLHSFHCNLPTLSCVHISGHKTFVELMRYLVRPFDLCFEILTFFFIIDFIIISVL